MVRRFGRPLPDDLGPGLYWCWPWPIDTVTRLQPARVHTVEIGFRTLPGSKAVAGGRAWSSLHANDGVRRIPEEAVMITGDGNLIELQGTLRYTIADPHVYLFEIAEPDALLRSAAESVLRETVAGRKFAELLTSDRGRFQDMALERLRERCGEYGGKGMGIALKGLDLHDLHPPQDVVAAYHDVTRAMEKRDQLVNQGEEKVLRDERRQQADGLKQVREAQSDSRNKVLLAQAEPVGVPGTIPNASTSGPGRGMASVPRRLAGDGQGPAGRRGGRGVPAPPRRGAGPASGVDRFPPVLGLPVGRPE